MTRMPVHVVWRIALITTIPVVDAFSSPVLLLSRSSSPVLTTTKDLSSSELQQRQRRCYVHQRQTMHPYPLPVSSLGMMGEGILEDVIYSAQSIGSSLANAVITSSSSSSSTVESIKSFGILYTAGLWTSVSPCSLG